MYIYIYTYIYICYNAWRGPQVWSGSSDGRVCSWNSKNKRLIRKIGHVREPVLNPKPC